MLSTDSEGSLDSLFRCTCLIFSEMSLVLNARNDLNMTIHKGCAQTASEKAKGNKDHRTNVSWEYLKSLHSGLWFLFIIYSPIPSFHRALVVMKFKTFLLWCLVMQILAELACPGNRNVSAAKALRDTNNPDCQTCALSNACQVFLQIKWLLYNSKSCIHDRSNPNFLHFFSGTILVDVSTVVLESPSMDWIYYV